MPKGGRAPPVNRADKSSIKNSMRTSGELKKDSSRKSNANDNDEPSLNTGRDKKASKRTKRSDKSRGS